MTSQAIFNGFDKNRSALVFIEFQAEWLSQESPLFQNLVLDKEPFLSAVSQAAVLLAAARQHACHIAHAGLDLRPDPHYRLFSGGHGVMGLRAAIPKAGTWIGRGADFVAPFVPMRQEFIVQGRSGASVLKNSTLDPYLRNNRIDTIFLSGFATHVCVESTLRDAHDSGLNVVVVRDACAAFTRAQDAYFHQNILHHFGASMDVATIVKQLSA